MRTLAGVGSAGRIEAGEGMNGAERQRATSRGPRPRAPGLGLTALGSLLLIGLFAACDVEWGGGSIALEDPAPPPDTTAAAARLEPEQLPLPSGPHLLLVRLNPDGSARATPLAAIDTTGSPIALSDVTIPEAEDPTFRARFDATFLADGAELDLLARGARLGTLVLEGTPAGSGQCASIAAGRALLVPGQDVPQWAFAVPRGLAGEGAPERRAALQTTNSMSVASPVLAERIIGERGFLARRVALSAVRLPGDTLPGMAVTYLVADSLGAGPPGEDAVSLFLLARFEPAQGYIPVWQELRRYSSPGDKEAFAYLDWIGVGGTRLDVLRRFDAGGATLATGQAAGSQDYSVSWVEPGGCTALTRLHG